MPDYDRYRNVFQARMEGNALSAARNIIKTSGLGGLYQGGGAQLIRELPFNAVQFLAFHSTMRYLSELHWDVGLPEKVSKQPCWSNLRTMGPHVVSCETLFRCDVLGVTGWIGCWSC